MRIMVTEMPVGDALERARTRFEQLDRRMAHAYESVNPGTAVILTGVVTIAVGVIAAFSGLPIASDAGMALAIALLIAGGGLLGYGLPRWSRTRAEGKGLEQRRNHALENLRLRESQAAEDPELTVEVLSRIDGQDPLLTAQRTGAHVELPAA